MKRKRCSEEQIIRILKAHEAGTSVPELAERYPRYGHPTLHAFIEPGKPTQNTFVESFNGKFREYCLNLHWFRNIEEAQEQIDEWHRHYNEVRPHRSLGMKPPAIHAQEAA